MVKPGFLEPDFINRGATLLTVKSPISEVYWPIVRDSVPDYFFSMTEGGGFRAGRQAC